MKVKRERYSKNEGCGTKKRRKLKFKGVPFTLDWEPGFDEDREGLM